MRESKEETNREREGGGGGGGRERAKRSKKPQNRLKHKRTQNEACEIRNHNSGPGRGLNEDNGAYLKTDIWDPVLNPT